MGLAGNRLSVQSCVVLAAGMRATRCLDELNLDNNPLGPDGGAAIIEALARRHVGTITLQGCNFSNAANNRAGTGEVVFDIQRPNRTYRLDLSSAAHYAVGGVLCRYWQHERPETWRSATLDGQVRAALPMRLLPCTCSSSAIAAAAGIGVGMRCVCMHTRVQRGVSKE